MTTKQVHQLSVEDVLRIRARLAETRMASRDFGAARPLYPDRLESSVARQDAGFGDFRKYSRLQEVAATLFFGLVTAHAFENGNKRTGLVSLLVMLKANSASLNSVTEDQLYELATNVADWKQHEWPRPGADGVVSYVASWLRTNLTEMKSGFRAMTTRDFLNSLRALGCSVGPPDRSFVRIVPPPGIDGGRIASVVYRDEGREVPARLVRDTRRKLGLTADNGVFEAGFFELEPTVDQFVLEYASVLERLADT